MINFVKKTFKYYLVKNIFLIILYLIIITLIYTIGSFVFFDNNRIESFYGNLYNIPGWDYYILNSIGLEGIAIQGYVFLYIFLVFLLLIIYFFDGVMSLRRDRDVISLLKVRGFSFAQSNGLFLFIKSIGLISISLISVLLFLCISFVINKFLDIQMPLLIIDAQVLIELLIFDFLYFLINIPFYTFPFSEKNLIKTIRNFY